MIKSCWFTQFYYWIFMTMSYTNFGVINLFLSVIFYSIYNLRRKLVNLLIYLTTTNNKFTNLFKCWRSRMMFLYSIRPSFKALWLVCSRLVIQTLTASCSSAICWSLVQLPTGCLCQGSIKCFYKYKLQINIYILKVKQQFFFLLSSY